jgi:hypothetical protein
MLQVIDSLFFLTFPSTEHVNLGEVNIHARIYSKNSNENEGMILK